MPNTISKIFSFLRNKSKSQKLVEEFLRFNPSLGAQCPVHKYYTYQKQLKTSLDKYLVVESIEKLFERIDDSCGLFTKEEQETIIRINAFLIMNYIRSPFFILALINSRKVAKDKIKEYVAVVRIIRIKA